MNSIRAVKVLFVVSCLMVTQLKCMQVATKQKPFYFQVAPDYTRSDKPLTLPSQRSKECYTASPLWLNHSGKVSTFCSKHPSRGRDTATAIVVPLEEDECRLVENQFHILLHDEPIRALFFKDTHLIELVKIAKLAYALSVNDLLRPLTRALVDKLINFEMGDQEGLDQQLKNELRSTSPTEFIASPELQLFCEIPTYLSQIGLTEELKKALAPFVLSKTQSDTIRKSLFSRRVITQKDEEAQSASGCAQAFHPREPIVATITGDHEIRFCSTEQDIELARIPLTSRYRDITYSADGTALMLSDHESPAYAQKMLLVCHYPSTVLAEAINGCTFEQKLLLNLCAKLIQRGYHHSRLRVYNFLHAEIKTLLPSVQVSPLKELFTRPHARTILTTFDKRIILPLLLGDEHFTPDEQGLYLIHKAAASGNSDALDYVSSLEGTIDLRDGKGATALHHVVLHETECKRESEGLRLVYGALNAGADQSCVDEDGKTALDYAVAGKRFMVVQELLLAQMKKERYIQGTILHYAACKGYALAVPLILEHIPIDTPDDEGFTPVHRAVEAGQDVEVRLLVAAGADLTTCTGDAQGNETLLHCAVQHNHLALASFLVVKGVKLFARNKWGETPLFQAAGLGNLLMVKQLLKDAVKQFLSTKIIHQPAANGRTPLHGAALKGSVAIVIALCNAGAEVNARTLKGETPLHLTSHSACLEELLSRKADPTIQNSIQMTPLDMALEQNNLHFAELLLASGARLESADKCGRTVIHRAAMKGNSAFLQLLYRRAGGAFHNADGLGNAPLHYAAESGSIETVQLLGELGALQAAVNKQGQIAAHSALLKNNHECAALLLMKEIGGLPCAHEQWSPAHCAAFRGYTALIDYMLLQPATKELLTSKKWTLLHVAAYGGSAKMIQLLLGAGLDKSALTADGETALDLARDRQNQEVMALL